MCFSNLYLYNICSTTTQPKYKLFTLSVSRDSLKMCSLKLTNYHLRHTEVSLSAYDNQKLVYFFQIVFMHNKNYIHCFTLEF